jgi:hypothetical protein
MDWTAEEMKELKCFLFGQPLRPTRAHDISPIMRLEFGVFGINSAAASPNLRSRLPFPYRSKRAPVAVIRLVLARLAPNYISGLRPIFLSPLFSYADYTAFTRFWTHPDTVFHLDDISAI